MNITQGEIWLIDFSPSVGNEQTGRRPALILSNDHFNGMVPGLTIAVPTTSRCRGWATHVRIEPKGTGLKEVSWIMTEQVRALSQRRLLGRLGTAPRKTVAEVTDLVRELL